MSRDFYSVLRLTPGIYPAREITQQFRLLRKRMLSDLENPALNQAAGERLEELHVAYRALRDPADQACYLKDRFSGGNAGRLRHIIQASLEDGVLRYSRRLHLLEHGRKLGFTEFQTQLIIAQVQFGDGRPDAVGSHAQPVPRVRTWPFVAAALCLAAAMFAAVVQMRVA